MVQKHDRDQYNEKMKSSHLSDLRVYKMRALDLGFASSIFHRSRSRSKLHMSQLYKFECGVRRLDNLSNKLPPSNSWSLKNCSFYLCSKNYLR
jgi:hypothetical protein